METPPLARYIPQNSKKRICSGSSSSYMDPDVIEISPPIAQSSKSKAKKEVMHHEVIDIDMEEDPVDVMIIDDFIESNNKGKEPLTNFSDPGSVDGVLSSKKNGALGLINSINVDGFSSDLSYGDDEYLDMYCESLMYDDECAMLQAHFDSTDFPPGVEVPIPWLTEPPLQINKHITSSSSFIPPSLHVESDASILPEPPQTRKKLSSRSSSSLDLSPSLSSFHLIKNKKKVASSTGSPSLSSHTPKSSVNNPFKADHDSGWRFADSSRSKRKNAYSMLSSQAENMKITPGNGPSLGGLFFHNSLRSQVGTGSSTPLSFPQAHIVHPLAHSLGTYDPSKLLWQSSHMFSDFSSLIGQPEDLDMFPGVESYNPWLDPSLCPKNATGSGSSTYPSESVSDVLKNENEKDILDKFQDFKKFGTVEDHSDHHYVRSGSSVKKQPSKSWGKKIQEEWKILEKDLPDTICVRVYESRMDLLRAVIVGAEGTPYHDGLFFFDVFFPCDYPNVPPHVFYHSGGLRLNPNLYNTGKVCLSLLNTWSGNQNEKWIPGMSTILQVLVSIQGLILNAKPYFNEPGYERMSGLPSGEISSQKYNESTFILSLKTMVYTMRKPPKHFEDFVLGHFYTHAHDILVACKAYMDGAQVGCLTKGGVQDLEAGDKSCSQSFKASLSAHMNMLVQAFIQIGVKDCEKYLSPPATSSVPQVAAATAHNNH